MRDFSSDPPKARSLVALCSFEVASTCFYCGRIVYKARHAPWLICVPSRSPPPGSTVDNSPIVFREDPTWALVEPGGEVLDRAHIQDAYFGMKKNLA